MKTINGKTTILAVFGDPVGHSMSPVMHNAAFEALGWNCVYIPCHVLSEDITLAVRGIRAMGFKGVNITLPHKQAVVPELDQVFGDAALSGSVNTIINRDGKLLGTSTDGSGLIGSLKEEGHFDVAGKNVLLLGAGGAAWAVVFSLVNAGIRSLTLVNRDLVKAVSLREKVFANSKFELQVRELVQLASLDWDNYDLVINTTAVGLRDEQSLVPKHLLNPRAFIYDVVYKRGGTTLVREAAAAGCQVLTGLSMLLYQGAESFRLWFETEPPVQVMREALQKAMK